MHLSCGDRLSVRVMLAAVAAMFRCSRGTIFGREVVPDV